MNFQPEPASLSQDWNLNTRKHISLEIHGTYVVTCLILDVPRDLIITASDDHTIAVYTLFTGQLMSTLVGHEGGIWSLSSIYYDGQHLLVSGSTDKTVRIWDLVSGKCLHVFRGHSGTVRCLDVVSPAMEESSVKVKELSDKLPLIVTGSRDKSVKVWSIPGKDKTSFIADEVCAATTERVSSLTFFRMPMQAVIPTICTISQAIQNQYTVSLPMVALQCRVRMTILYAFGILFLGNASTS